jgi:hypothetical protein
VGVRIAILIIALDFSKRRVSGFANQWRLDVLENFNPMLPGAETTAAVCVGGHCIAWSLAGIMPPNFCPKCGKMVIISCENPECQTRLPGDPYMADHVPFHHHCYKCGHAYPWTAARLEMVRQTLELQSEADEWDTATKARADELLGHLVDDSATPGYVKAVVRWIDQHGAETAGGVVRDLVTSAASEALKAALKASGFPIP